MTLGFHTRYFTYKYRTVLQIYRGENNTNPIKLLRISSSWEFQNTATAAETERLSTRGLMSRTTAATLLCRHLQTTT